nr:hypothetical protein LVJ77_11475 [Conchiformibius kuhniae]
MLGYFWRLILKLLRIFSELTAWVLCVWLMNTAFSLMTVRHFSAGDVPDRYFPVLVQDEQAQFYVKDWERLSNQGHQPVRDESKTSSRRGLRTLAPNRCGYLRALRRFGHRHDYHALPH